MMAQNPDGAALFSARCATCHAENNAQARIPKPSELAARTPEAVMSALFGGVMTSQAQGLTNADGRALARFLTGKDPSSTNAAAAAEAVAGQCATPPKAL